VTVCFVVLNGFAYYALTRLSLWPLCLVLSHWVHFTVHNLDLVVFICVYFVFHTAYMLCYCQRSGVDLVGLKPSLYDLSSFSALTLLVGSFDP